MFSALVGVAAMSLNYSVVYDKEENAVTVTLKIIGDEVDFSTGDDVPTKGIDKLVLVGRLSAGNFRPSRPGGSWHDRFVPTPVIDVSGLDDRFPYKIWSRVTVPGVRVRAAWGNEDYLHCLLPLEHLRPREIRLPLRTRALTFLQNHRDEGHKTKCMWDLGSLTTTNLADLHQLTEISRSFNGMLSLIEVALPPKVMNILQSFTDSGLGQVWQQDPFEGCTNLYTVYDSFNAVPCVSIVLEPPSEVSIRGSFNQCNAMATFSCAGFEFLVDSLNNNSALTMLELKENPNELPRQAARCNVTRSATECPNLETLTVTKRVRIDSSFNGLGKITEVAIPVATQLIVKSFNRCPKLWCVSFPNDTGERLDKIYDVDEAFCDCAIEIVSNFEFTRVTELKGSTFSGNPLRYIAAPPTVENIDDTWASRMQATATEHPSHLDLSRLSVFRLRDNRGVIHDTLTRYNAGRLSKAAMRAASWSSMQDEPPASACGFDHVWITRINLTSMAIGERRGGVSWFTEDLVLLLINFTHAKSVVHCSAGHMNDIEGAVKEFITVRGVGPVHMPELKFAASKLYTLEWYKQSLMQMDPARNTVMQMMLMSQNRGMPLTNTPDEVGATGGELELLPKEVLEHLMMLVINGPFFRDATEDPNSDGSHRQ
jgi:hypothetical protein